MSNKCCGKTRRLIASNATGSIAQVTEQSSGRIQNLTCCEKPPHPPAQQLVSNWKQRRSFVFSTVPLSYGKMSFSTNVGSDISGPPKPGDSGPSMTGAGIIIEPPPPPPVVPPVSIPTPPGQFED